jgi:hypothetical protein
MAITERRIRQIIREEAKRSLQEMPYAGDLGVAYGEDQETDSFFAAEVSATGANRRGAAKYPTTRKFRELAEKHFSNIPYGVWLAPFIGLGEEAGVSDDPEAPGRGAVMDLVPGGIERLERLGFKSPARVGPDDLVILYSSMVTDPGAIASPWLIFHSIFDTQRLSEKLVPTYSRMYDLLVYGGEAAGAIGALSNLTDNAGPERALISTLTMASARNGELGGPGDALAEMMCQELLTKSGLRLDLDALEVPAGSARSADGWIGSIKALERRVKQMAAEFRSNARGKLIITATN